MEVLNESTFLASTYLDGDKETFLIRPRLEKLLDKAIQYPLVLMVAGAGYGKTKSVYSYLLKKDVLVSWLTLTPLDNNPDRFWQIFIRAAGSTSRASLEAIPFPETKQQFAQYLELSKAVPGLRSVFVFDGLEVIHNKAVLRFIERSMYTLFPNITTILLSRSEPGLNTLGFLSRGFLFRIGEEELRFTREEMAEYFLLQQLALPDEELDQVWEDSEGWPLTVRLAGMAVKNRLIYERGNKETGYMYPRSSMKRIVFEILDREVFAGISPELQRFLVKLSLIEHQSLELLELLGTKELLGELHALYSFFSSDPFSGSYHIHGFLMKYLRQKQGELSEEEKKKIFIEAGQWCAANELKIDAMEYYERAGDYEKIVELGYTLLRPVASARVLQVLAIMDRMPRRIYKTIASAHALHSRMLFLAGRTGEAVEEIKQTINLFSTRSALPFNRRVLYGAYLNEGFLKSSLCLLTRNYNFPRSFNNAYKIFKTGTILDVDLPCYSTHGLFVTCVGAAGKKDMDVYLKAVTETTPKVAEMLGGYSWGMIECCLEELYYARGELDRAEAYALEAIRKTREKHQYELECRALAILLLVFYARGNAENCGSVLEQMKILLNYKQFTNRQFFYDAYTALFYSRMGLVHCLPAWTRDILTIRGGDTAARATEVYIKVHYLLSEKHYVAALGLIEQENQGLNHYLFGKITVSLIRAICYYHLKEYDKSMNDLEKARMLAKPNGLDMFFIEEGREMRALACHARKDPNCTIDRIWLLNIARRASAYAKKTAAIAPFFGISNLKKDKVLTIREKELLSNLAMGMTRQELAHHYALSLNTIKSTIKRLYNKLDAFNLMDALSRARALGLLKN